MTTNFSVELELDQDPPTGDDLDTMLEELADFFPSVRAGQGRSTQILMSIPATSTRQATMTGLALTERYGTPLKLTTQTAERRALEEDWPTIPELISVAEAAAILGVTRQRVLQMINEGRLPRHTVGRANVLPRRALCKRTTEPVNLTD